MDYHRYKVGQLEPVALGQAPEKGYNAMGEIIKLIPWAYLVKIGGVEYSVGNEDIAEERDDNENNEGNA